MTWEDIKKAPIKVIWKEYTEGLLIVGSDDYIRILHNNPDNNGSRDSGSKLKYPQYKYGYAFTSVKVVDFDFKAWKLVPVNSSNLLFKSVKKFNL